MDENAESTQEVPDFYAVLEVPRNATDADLKKGCESRLIANHVCENSVFAGLESWQ
jgi:hypothetical protein